ncbi:hypothetical protein T492DRAFT_397105 [Pavlovales sp. CCMP2436]|nr:hypothetical protein T492DRAFT_397105 [Pavlovales sp. CCMP2436]
MVALAACPFFDPEAGEGRADYLRAPGGAEATLLCALGATGVTEAAMLAREVMPRFGELDASKQKAVREFLLARWPVLKSDPALRAALANTAWVPVENARGGGALSRPIALLDPRNPSWHLIGSAGLFPAEASDQWLRLLAEVGMQSEVDANSLLLCARRLEALALSADGGGRGGEGEGEGVAQKAVRLVIYLGEHWDTLRASDSSFGERLGCVSCVPAPLPPGALGGCASGGGGAPGGGGGLLCRFGDCCIEADAMLACSVLRVLPAALTPPRSAWAALGLRSPPLPSTVAAHVARLSEMPASQWAAASRVCAPLPAWAAGGAASTAGEVQPPTHAAAEAVARLLAFADEAASLAAARASAPVPRTARAIAADADADTAVSLAALERAPLTLTLAEVRALVRREDAAGLRAELEVAGRELGAYREALICQICQDRQAATVLVGCGHRVCGVCVRSLQLRCPFCRQGFTATCEVRLG